MVREILNAFWRAMPLEVTRRRTQHPMHLAQPLHNETRIGQAAREIDAHIHAFGQQIWYVLRSAVLDGHRWVQRAILRHERHHVAVAKARHAEHPQSPGRLDARAARLAFSLRHQFEDRSALVRGAREKLDVVTVIYANRGYKILANELKRMGARTDGAHVASMFDLQDPSLDWVALAQGMGVDAVRVEARADFDAAFERAMKRPGPMLIEAVI
jgi:hypothetical protein